MLKLITIIQSLKEKSRPLTVEEDLYLNQIKDEIDRAESDAARWRILEREGFNQIDIETYGFDDDLTERVLKLRRSAMS